MKEGDGDMKKILTLVFMALVVIGLCVGCVKEEGSKKATEVSTKNSSAEKDLISKPETMKLGMAVQDLSNPIWSGAAEELRKLVESNGGEMSYVACDSNISKQIQQVENFIASGIDALVIHPADPAGIESVLADAMAAGVKVFAWDDNLEHADIAWLIDNYELGYLIGTYAASWINDTLGGEAEVAILNYPQLPILLERGNGIVAAITEQAPRAEIIAETSAINVAEGITKMETIFQSHPNVQVVAAIGGGGAVGANEAAKANDKITDQFGIFAADATDPELAAIAADEGNRASIMMTGGPKEMAAEIYDWLLKLVSEQEIPKEVYREFIPITKDNVNQYYQ